MNVPEALAHEVERLTRANRRLVTGRNVRMYRTAYPMRVERLADLSGCMCRRILDIEAADYDYEPPKAVIERIASALGVTLAELERDVAPLTLRGYNTGAMK